jgi:alkylmercury lyase
MLSGPLGELADSNSLLRAAAFHLLLTSGQPVTCAELAKASGFELERTTKTLEDLDSDGRIRRDDAGRVVGSAGLSVIPDSHEIDLAGRTFWTWCAYDILGIFGALRANGTARSPSPPDCALIELRFLDGRPQEGDAVVFRPGEELMSGCDNVYAEWCPNSNLFLSRKLAEAWASEHQLSGRVLGLEEASDLATNEWQDVARRLSL